MQRLLIPLVWTALFSAGAFAKDDVQSAPPTKSVASEVKAPKSTPAMLAQGKAVYATHCLSCHGEQGRGDGSVGRYLTPGPGDFSTGQFKHGAAVEQVFQTINDGVKNTMMMGWSHLPEQERWALAHYVLGLVQPKDKGQKQ